VIKPGDELYYDYGGTLGALLDKKLKEVSKFPLDETQLKRARI